MEINSKQVTMDMVDLSRKVGRLHAQRKPNLETTVMIVVKMDSTMMMLIRTQTTMMMLVRMEGTMVENIKMEWKLPVRQKVRSPMIGTTRETL